MELPLVSVCFFTYNQEKYVEEALLSILNQNYSPLELIISDDCSNDKSFETIKDVLKNYKGSAEIILNRNVKNLGLVQHVNKILYDISKGDYVVLAAGDDISHPERISESIHFLLKNPEVCALSSSLNIIDENSKFKDVKIEKSDNNIVFDISYYLSKNYKHINGPSRVLSRKLINAFPKLNANCHTEDTTFLFRAFLFGKVALISNKLVNYRVHENNISSPEGLKKMNINNIFNQYYNDLSYSRGRLIEESIYNDLVLRLNENKLVRVNENKNLSKTCFIFKILEIFKKNEK